MKKIICIIALAILSGCNSHPAGTLENIDEKEDSIQVYQYHYNDDGGWVYVSFFKSSPNVQTLTWHQQVGKAVATVGNVMVKLSKSYTLASIRSKGVILKKKDVLGDGHCIVIQTKDDIVKEKITEDQYNILAEGDTIK